MGVQLPSEPITRKEQYLAKAAGQAVEIPAEPITREEAYLEAIANAGGGGGGTTNYNQLSNKPQINSVELSGNKTLSDLGIASASELANKVDKVAGKDLSSNDYSDTEKQKNADNATAISAIKDGATIDSFADVESALSNKQDTLTFDDAPTDGSNNPVKSNGVYDALELKQNATDNSLDTDAKTIVGAINEHEGDIGSLKSGLTTLDNEVNGDATVYPYADVITIEDAVPANLADCNVKIEPVQDLHGYDKPWVGGAGKNKLPLTVDIAKSLNGGGTWTGNTYNFRDVDFTVNTDSDGNVTSVKVNGTASQNVTLLLNFVGTASTEYYIGGCPAGGGNTYYFDTFSDGVPRTADYGSGATFTADGNSQYVRIGVQQGYNAQNLMFYPMICLNSETDKSFAPYSNICPITGHTEASVQRDGKNVWTGNDSYTIATAGHIIPNTTIALPAGKYALDFEASNPSEVFEFEVFKGNSVDWANRLVDNVFTAKTRNIVEFTLTEASTNLRLYSTAGASISNVRLYSTVETYTIALGDTIYGGTVDFDSGVMTATHEYVEYDGRDGEIWTMYGASSASAYAVKKALPHTAKAFTDYPYIIANELETISQLDTWGNYNSFITQEGSTEYNRGFIICGLIDISTTPEAWRTYLASNPLHVCYELATPTTIQLTPQQIQLLKGQNTLYASTGQISVTANGVSGAIGSVQEQVNATDEALAELAAEIAEQLPTAPTTDGAYVLTVTVADGTPTYSWESAT